MTPTWVAVGCVCWCVAAAADQSPRPGPRGLSQREAATRQVAEVIRADYEGNRTKLATLRDGLVVPADDPQLASRVHYWRGFAMWRRAINGFNDGVAPAELARDLQTAIDDFQASLTVRPSFVDAKVGLISAIGYQGYLARGDSSAMLASLARMLGASIEALIDAPDHPRLLWVLGPSLWFTPPGTADDVVRARQARAIRTYERALERARAAAHRAPVDPLEPRWGEPELLMSLAWSNLNRATPDVAAAERHARAALALVPHWHYVRDILLPQIRQATRASGGSEPVSGRFRR